MAYEAEPQTTTKKICKGRYLINKEWIVWQGINGRWYGQSNNHPNEMIDAPTLNCAKLDIKLGYTVQVGGAGV